MYLKNFFFNEYKTPKFQMHEFNTFRFLLCNIAMETSFICQNVFRDSGFSGTTSTLKSVGSSEDGVICMVYSLIG